MFCKTAYQADSLAARKPTYRSACRNTMIKSGREQGISASSRAHGCLYIRSSAPAGQRQCSRRSFKTGCGREKIKELMVDAQSVGGTATNMMRRKLSMPRPMSHGAECAAMVCAISGEKQFVCRLSVAPGLKQLAYTACFVFAYF
jgi:hypothetical protein